MRAPNEQESEHDYQDRAEDVHLERRHQRDHDH
jgi:hypothetical protein